MVVLIIPPVSDCFMPTLGVAQIAGYLEERNIDCNVFDMGAELNYSLFSEVKKKLPIKDIVLDGGEYTYKNLVSSLNFFSANNEKIKLYTDDLKIPFDWKEIDKSIEFINQDNELLWRLSNLNSINKIRKMKGVVYCGMSISYESQVIPALMLAKIIKESCEAVKICIGGSLLYNYEEDFYKFLYSSELIDVLILGAGEKVFEYIEMNKLNELSSDCLAKIVQVQEKYIIDTRECQLNPIVYNPKFEDFDFNLYPVRSKAFPYMIKDKCYYGKCKFCNGDKVMIHNNSKSIKEAFECIENIIDRLAVNNVYLVDAALSPVDLKTIGNMRLKNKISWIANARFEKALTDEGLIRNIANKGCQMLRFGFESGAQKVLDYMNKGTKVGIAEEVLQLTSKYGIKNHLYIMFGYPGEGEKERKETLEFIERNKQYIYSYSVSVFQPVPGTPIYEELEKKIEMHDNEYQRIIELIYDDEKEYEKLYKDIMRISEILKDYAQTNLEFYSANIFNYVVSEKKNRKFIIMDKIRYLTLFPEKMNVKDIIRVEEFVKSKDCKEYIYIDFYNNITVWLRVSEEVIHNINNDYEVFASDQKIIELREILNNGRTRKKYDNYKLSDLKQDISNEMSVQFKP